ncbi:MAG: GldG family protein [Oscillospiraceae bacterium]|nr:GldG family protein [Oscillospiraceae bacterium]
MSEENKNLDISEIENETDADEILDEFAETETEFEESLPEEKEKKIQSGSVFNLLRSRKLKRGGFSVAVTVIFIAAVILANVIANTLMSRFDVRFDLTENKLYSIEKSTAEYLAGIDDVVNIYFCSTEEAFPHRGNMSYVYSQVMEIADRFAEANRKFNVIYVDRLSNPMFSADYGGNLTDTDIIIESERTGRYKVIKENEYAVARYFIQGQQVTYADAYYADMLGMDFQVNVSASAEVEFLSAIMTVTDLTPVKVAFTSGYGEGVASDMDDIMLYVGVVDILEKNGYLIEHIEMFTTEVIPPEIDFLIIFSPTSDYSVSDVNKVDAWLENNGNFGKTLLYFPAPRNDVRHTPNLDALMEEWGIKTENGYIIQTDSRFTSADYQGHEQYIGAISEFSSGVNEKPFVGIFMRPFSLLFERRGNYTTTPLITGYEGTVFMPFNYDPENEEFEGWEPVVEPLNAAVMSQKQTSRILAFGSLYLFAPSYLDADNFSNAQFLLNVFHELSGREKNTIFIIPPSFNPTRFEITASQANTIAIVFVIVLPLLIITTGLIVFFRRRYK